MSFMLKTAHRSLVLEKISVIPIVDSFFTEEELDGLVNIRN